jgi:hypothetical protein
MDNISVLRQLTRETTTEPVVVFFPADATRSVTPGVAFDYYLKSAADKVTIEILDAQGTSIRAFTGVPPKDATPAQPGAPPAEGEEGSFRAPAARVAVKQGINRFTWDMRYPDARDFPGLIMWAGSTRGPLAAPGRYTVKLTAHGVTKAQDFRIRRNEAVKTATDADLQAQFTLAREINDKVTVANEAVLRIRSVKDQIADRVAKTADATIKAAGQALAEKLTAIEGEIYQYRNRSSQDPLNFPIRLNNKLAALQGIVESGDNKPTDQSYAVFKDLSARLDKQLAALDAVVKAELPGFNKALAGNKLDPVKDGIPPRPES